MRKYCMGAASWIGLMSLSCWCVACGSADTDSPLESDALARTASAQQALPSGTVVEVTSEGATKLTRVREISISAANQRIKFGACDTLVDVNKDKLFDGRDANDTPTYRTEVTVAIVVSCYANDKKTKLRLESTRYRNQWTDVKWRTEMRVDNSVRSNDALLDQLLQNFTAKSDRNLAQAPAESRVISYVGVDTRRWTESMFADLSSYGVLTSDLIGVPSKAIDKRGTVVGYAMPISAHVSQDKVGKPIVVDVNWCAAAADGRLTASCGVTRVVGGADELLTAQQIATRLQTTKARE